MKYLARRILHPSKCLKRNEDILICTENLEKAFKNNIETLYPTNIENKSRNPPRIIPINKFGVNTEYYLHHPANKHPMNNLIYWIQEQISTNTYKHCKSILFTPETTSTQSNLISKAEILGREVATEGLVHIAGSMTEGVGRMGNYWIGGEGCLMFSFSTLDGVDANRSRMQYVVALAMCKAVRYTVPYAQIKWPNDIYICGRKVAGIMSNVLGGREYIYGSNINSENIYVHGVGVNIWNLVPEIGCRLRDFDAYIKMVEILDRFFNEFYYYYYLLQNSEFKRVIKEYEDCWMHTGMDMKMIDQRGGERGCQIIGITDTGALKIKYYIGEEEHLDYTNYGINLETKVILHKSYKNQQINI